MSQRAPLKLLRALLSAAKACGLTRNSFGGRAWPEMRPELGARGSGRGVSSGTQASHQGLSQSLPSLFFDSSDSRTRLVAGVQTPCKPCGFSTASAEFHLLNGAGLVLVDWFTSGRAARGERWAFDTFQSRNDVFIDGERMLSVPLCGGEDGPDEHRPHRTGRFNCFAMLLVVGQLLRQPVAALASEISSRPVERNGAVVCSAGGSARHGANPAAKMSKP